MQIGRNWKIESDPLNIVLLRRHVSRKGDKKGQEYWTAEGYYSSLANALHDMVNFEIKETELKDLNTIMNKLNEIHKLIEKAWKEDR